MDTLNRELKCSHSVFLVLRKDFPEDFAEDMLMKLYGLVNSQGLDPMCVDKFVVSEVKTTPEGGVFILRPTNIMDLDEGVTPRIEIFSLLAALHPEKQEEFYQTLMEPLKG